VPPASTRHPALSDEKSQPTTAAPVHRLRSAVEASSHPVGSCAIELRAPSRTGEARLQADRAGSPFGGAMSVVEMFRQPSARMGPAKRSYGCETPQNSNLRLAVCHRWLWLCASAHSRSLHRDHARIRWRAPSLLAPPSLSVVSSSCRLPVQSRTTRNIDRERQPSAKSAVRMGENAAGGAADIRCCK